MKNDTSFQVEQVEQEEKAVEDSTLGVFGEDWHKWMGGLVSVMCLCSTKRTGPSPCVLLWPCPFPGSAVPAALGPVFRTPVEPGPPWCFTF